MSGARIDHAIPAQLRDPPRVHTSDVLALALASLALAPAAASCAPLSHSTVAYRSIPGVARNLTSLDLYVAPKRRRHRKAVPVVAWVHGGGYRKGDKAQQVADKVALSRSAAGSSPALTTGFRRPARAARYPDHYDDVASAVAWLRKHVRARGGDPKRIGCWGTPPAPTSSATWP